MFFSSLPSNIDYDALKKRVEGRRHFNSCVLPLSAGVVLLDVTGAEQQTAIRVLFAHHSIRSLPGEGDGGDCDATRMELHIDHLRGEQLRREGVRGARGVACRAQHLHRRQREAGEGLGRCARASVRHNRSETADEVESER